MIEIVNPGLLCLTVDEGRNGFAHIGVPSSSALDRYALRAVNYLTGNSSVAPALEVMGKGFACIAGLDVGCAITGARVRALIDGEPVPLWTPFLLPAGKRLIVAGVDEGFRYYIGFSGKLALEEVMGSCATNVECGFGGFKGRPLLKGDVLEFEELPKWRGEAGAVLTIPALDPPHLLRLVEGPEKGYFTRPSLKKFFSDTGPSGFMVSARSNRTGIRLEGRALTFKEGAEKSIDSEGVIPGTIQIPGDGKPIITLHERTLGGYARLGVIVRADRDLLAHLKPADRVCLKLVSLEEGEELWRKRQEALRFP
ncbi:MAG TPA: biotin-dependent carboxyltransferase family protein [Syntrophorhabdaceae bacterium]|jgi:antagonist of KipI